MSTPAPETRKTLLEVRNLHKTYRLPGRKTLKAVDDISFSVRQGEVLGLVGESGCGKSTLGRCLLRLLPVSSGEILFDGQNITSLPERKLRPLRQKLQMVFQDSSASLNPRRRIGDLLAEPLRVHSDPTHGKRSATVIADRLTELLDLVGLPRSALERYPHEFSGGQKQRINIARALTLSPQLIVADEPVSALDVSVQAQIINLFADLQEKLSLTYVFISHDLSVVRQISTRVAVMYLGSIVEMGETDAVLHKPVHPYTAMLTQAIPHPTNGKTGLQAITGDIPSPVSRPSGCHFHPRCPYAQPLCREKTPKLETIAFNHSVSCHFPLAPL